MKRHKHPTIIRLRPSLQDYEVYRVHRVSHQSKRATANLALNLLIKNNQFRVCCCSGAKKVEHPALLPLRIR
jgi:hypothetical protein